VKKYNHQKCHVHQKFISVNVEVPKLQPESQMWPLKVSAWTLTCYSWKQYATVSLSRNEQWVLEGSYDAYAPLNMYTYFKQWPHISHFIPFFHLVLCHSILIISYSFILSEINFIVFWFPFVSFGGSPGRSPNTNLAIWLYVHSTKVVFERHSQVVISSDCKRGGSKRRFVSPSLFDLRRGAEVSYLMQ